MNIRLPNVFRSWVHLLKPLTANVTKTWNTPRICVLGIFSLQILGVWKCGHRFTRLPNVAKTWHAPRICDLAFFSLQILGVWKCGHRFSRHPNVRCPYIRVGKFRESFGVWKNRPPKGGYALECYRVEARKMCDPRMLAGAFFSPMGKFLVEMKRILGRSQHFPLVFEKEANVGFTF